MRAAKRGDYRRRLGLLEPKLVLREFAAPELAREVLAFTSPITAICGPNGAGKTRLLKGLAQTLGCMNGTAGEPLRATGVAALRYRFEGADHLLTFGPAAGFDAAHGTAFLFEPPHYAMSVLAYVRSTANLAELLEPYAPVTATVADLKTLSYLINRKYDEVLTYEIDDPGGEPQTPTPMPYFKARSLGRSYGSESMGLGELSLFCLWWNLSRLENGSVVLIDEPEAFTSPHSQYALLDQIVRFCVDKQLTVILSTQSQPILDSLDIDSIRMLLPAEAGVEVLQSPAKPVLLNTLGMLVPKQGLLLVEDHVAAITTTAALGLLAPDILHIVDIFETSGTGPLAQALRMPRFGNRWFHLVGVMDGDQRAENHSDLRWPLVFLPGERSPETQMRAVLYGNEAEVATAVAREVGALQMALAAAAGRDDHDWLRVVAENLAVPVDQLTSALVTIWVDRDRAPFQAFSDGVRAHIET